MANYLTTDTDLTAVANAIRTKSGTRAQMEFPSGFVSAVQAIPTGGGGNAPILSTVINASDVTVTGGVASFSVTLPKTISKGAIKLEADSDTLTAIYAETTTTYYLVSIDSFYPEEFATNGSASMLKNGVVVVYRGSASSFYTRTISGTGALNIQVNDTTLSFSWSISNGATITGGKYNLTVWEIADS